MKNRWNRRKTLVLWLVIAVVFLTSSLYQRPVLRRCSKGNRFFQKKPCTLPEISVWYRLAWKRYVCTDSQRTFYQYHHRSMCSYVQRGHGIYSWSCICNNGKNSRYHCDMDHRPGHGNSAYASSDPYLRCMRKRT